jgi:hypothetical protein
MADSAPPLPPTPQAVVVVVAAAAEVLTTRERMRRYRLRQKETAERLRASKEPFEPFAPSIIPPLALYARV